MELGVLPMALRILILVCSLAGPGAKPSHRDAIPVDTSDRLAFKSSDVRPTGGHPHPLADCREDCLWSSRLLSDCDEDESEDDVQIPAFAIRQIKGIHLAISLSFPAYPSPLAAHFSSWPIPLRC